MRLDPEHREYVLTLTKGSVVQRLSVDPVSGRVTTSHVDGVSTYDAEFSDLTAFGGVWYPKREVIDFAAAKTHLELVTKDIALNEAPDLTLFEMTAPEGVPVIEVDEHGVPRQTP
jgi:outer membrane lipoprotein-sorting protein